MILRLFYTDRNSSRCALNISLYGPCPSGRFGEEKEFLALVVNRIEIPTVGESLRPAVMQGGRDRAWTVAGSLFTAMHLSRFMLGSVSLAGQSWKCFLIGYVPPPP